MNLLNKVFNYNLENLNKSANNFPGVDLGDFNAKIAFQVTSERTSDKIVDTYKKIYNNSYHNKVIANIFETKVFFFVITDSWKLNFKDTTLEKIKDISNSRFSKKDIITVSDIIKLIDELYDNDYNRFNEVYKLISNNIDDLPPLKSDKEILENLLTAFDRPAFTTPFYMESNLPKFKQALTDTIQFINTGSTPTNEIIVECKFDISNKKIKSQLDEIVDDLIKLRFTYESLIKSKEIRLCMCDNPNCEVHFLSEKACSEMDSSRNSLLKKVHILESYLIQDKQLK